VLLLCCWWWRRCCWFDVVAADAGVVMRLFRPLPLPARPCLCGSCQPPEHTADAPPPPPPLTAHPLPARPCLRPAGCPPLSWRPLQPRWLPWALTSATPWQPPCCWRSACACSCWAATPPQPASAPAGAKRGLLQRPSAWRMRPRWRWC
jgi:hypothetical protein